MCNWCLKLPDAENSAVSFTAEWSNSVGHETAGVIFSTFSPPKPHIYLSWKRSCQYCCFYLEAFPVLHSQTTQLQLENATLYPSHRKALCSGRADRTPPSFVSEHHQFLPARGTQTVKLPRYLFSLLLWQLTDRQRTDYKQKSSQERQWRSSTAWFMW